MVTAPQKFDGNNITEHRLLAFADAVRHFPDVCAVDTDIQDHTAVVYFEGHKSAVPQPMRDLAKALCVELPAPGNQRYSDSDDFEHGYRDYSNEHPQTVVTFRLGGALAKHQR